MIFRDGCKNNISLNQLTIVIVENIPEEKEPDVFTNPEIPKEKVIWSRDTIAVSMS